MTLKLPRPDEILAIVGGHTMVTGVEVVAATGSTNADLAAAARAGAEPGRVLVAGEQTAGRGRRARQWVSPPNTSISMSMLLAPGQPVENWGWLSLLAGLAVADALEELAPEPGRVELKWPNDVLIGGGKVCGILSEHVPTQGGSRAVVGMGINVGLDAHQLPVAGATSLRLEGWPQDHAAVIAAILRHFQRHFRSFEATGELREEYAARCASIGTPLTITVTENQVVHGTGHGVDASGCLQVATAGGIRSFAVGDVVHASMTPER